MSETTAAEGACVCGAVKIKAKAMSLQVGACNCSICRRWCGGPFLSVSCGTDVAIEGEDHVGIYDSSEWAERAFCKTCGSMLFYRFKSNGQHMANVALFGDIPALEFTRQVFVDERPHYYEFANQTANMTGAEIFEKFRS